MATKVQLEQRLAERDQELEAALSELTQLRRLLRSARVASQITKEDLDRKLEPFTLCEEAGSEQAERYERGLEVARERLETIWRALYEGQEVNTSDSLWRSTPTENDLYSAYLEQGTASISEETGDERPVD